MKGEKLFGYSKHAHTQPGEAPKFEDRTAYCAIEVEGQWKIVDPIWGAMSTRSDTPSGYKLIDDSGQGTTKV